MDQKEFILSFKEFANICYQERITLDNSIELFKIWYDNENQKWVNVRNYDKDD